MPPTTPPIVFLVESDRPEFPPDFPPSRSVVGSTLVVLGTTVDEVRVPTTVDPSEIVVKVVIIS
jgi:hypothetical protein